jgi:hypothetical protein
MRNLRIVLLLLLGCYGAAAAAEDFVDPPGRVARLSFVDGAVSIAPPGSDEWGEAVLNRPLTSGDRIWADASARAELEVGSATLRIDENTGLSFDNLTDDVMQMHLSSGVMTLHVGSLDAGQIVEVVTPNTTVTLLQRGDYTIEAAQSGDQTIVKTRNGEATVAGSSQQAYGVATNEQGVFNGTTDFMAEITGADPRTRFEDWVYAREARDQQSITARYVSPEVIGYRDLDTYGTWYDEPEYGHVWRPTLLVDDWAPYRFGRWIWVSPWGWTWIDDAPSHYGRWAYARNRWCWVPGPPHIRPVYAPALVGWVGDPIGNPGYAGNVGWFPLAPREAYLPGYRASWRHFHNVNVSNTVIVNNTYINDAYQGRAAPIDYHNRHVPHALTVVQHDAFVSARRVGDHRAQVTDDQARNWTAQGRAPTIPPNDNSVIGTHVNTPRSAPHSDRWASSNHTTVAPTQGDHAAFPRQPQPADQTHAQTTDRPAPHVPTATTSSHYNRTGQSAYADRPDANNNQHETRTQPTIPAPVTAPHSVPRSHGNPPPAEPAVAPQAPPEQHVQHQWNGRHQDDNARVPGNVAPAPQQQYAPNIATRPAQDTHVRQAESRQSNGVQPPPRTNAPTPAVAPEQQQAPQPASQRTAMGTPHGRHDPQDRHDAHPHAPEQSDRTGAAAAPQQP